MLKKILIGSCVLGSPVIMAVKIPQKKLARANALRLSLFQAVIQDNLVFIEKQISVLAHDYARLHRFMNQVDQYGNNALHIAALHGRHRLVNILSQFISTESVNKTGRTPLVMAVQEKNVDMVRALLKVYANINKQDEKFGRTPVLWAYLIDSRTIMDLLIDHGADLNIGSFYHAYLIHIAVQRNNADDLKKFLKHGARLNVFNANGLTPLALAHMLKREKIIKILENWR